MKFECTWCKGLRVFLNEKVKGKGKEKKGEKRDDNKRNGFKVTDYIIPCLKKPSNLVEFPNEIDIIK